MKYNIAANCREWPVKIFLIASFLTKNVGTAHNISESVMRQALSTVLRLWPYIKSSSISCLFISIQKAFWYD